MKAFVERHAVPIYFALAFAISWRGMLLVIGGPDGQRTSSARFEPVLPLVWLAHAAGPAVSGLLLTGLVARANGFRELLARLRTWRLYARWYAVALLTAPVMAACMPPCCRHSILVPAVGENFSMLQTVASTG